MNGHIIPPSRISKFKSLSSKLVQLERWIPKLVWPQVGALNTSTLTTSDLPTQCTRSLDQFIVGLHLQTKSALRVLDASGKFRPGFISKGQQGDFGSFQQCPSVTHRHCLVELSWPMPEYSDQLDHIDLPINGTWLDPLNKVYKVYYDQKSSLAVCFHHDCSSRDLDKIGYDYLSRHNIPLKFNIVCDSLNGSDVTGNAKTLKHICATILLSIAVVVCGGTIVRLLGGTKLRSDRVIACLDILDNGRKLVRQSNDVDSSKLVFLNGYRFSYGLAIIIGHMLTVGPIFSKVTHSTSLVNTILTMPLFMMYYTPRLAQLAFSINFAVSGFLAYYSWHSVLKVTKGQIGFTMYAVIRYIRTLPVMMATLLLIMAFPTEGLGSGPVFRATMNLITSNCVNNGWAELVALSNIFGARDIVSFRPSHSSLTVLIKLFINYS